MSVAERIFRLQDFLIRRNKLEGKIRVGVFSLKSVMKNETISFKVIFMENSTEKNSGSFEQIELLRILSSENYYSYSFG